MRIEFLPFIPATLAHVINQGKEIDKGDTESDFRFVSVPVEKLLDLIVRMAEKLKSRDANFQVIAPKYEGVVGVNALNEALRNALNPENPLRRELKSGSLVYREGDRVIVTKNDYKVGVYNGDTGKIASIERDSVIVKIHSGGYGVDRLIEFKKFDFGEKVRLAYAITTHRSQGSEYGTVILPMVPEQGRMLQRNLIYTAVTRAKQKVWVLGSIESVRKAIANDHVQFRGTGLAKALRSKVAQ
jgi:exodeoxyribonuclease V alpha subunit